MISKLSIYIKRESKELLILVTCPVKFNKWNSLRHVVGTNFAQNSCCTGEKVSANIKGTCPGNFFTNVQTLRFWTLQHVPATHLCNMSPQCVLDAIFPLLHVFARCPLSVYLMRFFPATSLSVYLMRRFCPLYMALQHVPSV